MRWIVLNKPSIDLIIIHSLNPAGGLNMESSLKASGYEAMRIPFTTFEANNVYQQFETLRNAPSSDNQDSAERED